VENICPGAFGVVTKLCVPDEGLVAPGGALLELDSRPPTLAEWKEQYERAEQLGQDVRHLASRVAGAERELGWRARRRSRRSGHASVLPVSTALADWGVLSVPVEPSQTPGDWIAKQKHLEPDRQQWLAEDRARDERVERAKLFDIQLANERVARARERARQSRERARLIDMQGSLRSLQGFERVRASYLELLESARITGPADLLSAVEEIDPQLVRELEEILLPWFARARSWTLRIERARDGWCAEFVERDPRGVEEVVESAQGATREDAVVQLAYRVVPDDWAENV
jgi:hypothetical protein